MYVEASRRRKGNDAKLELRSGLPTGKSCLSFFYNMHGGHKYMGTLRVLMNGETVFQKSGNQGNTWHKAELTYREGISSVRIQQETNLYVYVASGAAHDIATSAVMWQNNTHFVLINKNVGRKKKQNKIWPISSHIDRTSLTSGANIHESTETSVFFRASNTRNRLNNLQTLFPHVSNCGSTAGPSCLSRLTALITHGGTHFSPRL